MRTSAFAKMLPAYYDAMHGNDNLTAYHQRHGIESALILTVTDDEKADNITAFLRPRIEGKIVVEVGAGIGLLACHLATVAKRVYAIDADPSWASAFVVALYKHKPKNLTYILGAADEAPHIAADVAIFCTLSGQEALWKAASRFAPVVIDVYSEVMNSESWRAGQRRAGR